MEENRDELMIVEDINELDDEKFEEEYEEASSGLSWGALIAGIVLGALGAIGVRKGAGWWRKRKAKKALKSIANLYDVDEDEESNENESKD